MGLASLPGHCAARATENREVTIETAARRIFHYYQYSTQGRPPAGIAACGASGPRSAAVRALLGAVGYHRLKHVHEALLQVITHRSPVFVRHILMPPRGMTRLISYPPNPTCGRRCLEQSHHPRALSPKKSTSGPRYTSAQAPPEHDVGRLADDLLYSRLSRVPPIPLLASQRDVGRRCSGNLEEIGYQYPLAPDATA